MDFLLEGLQAVTWQQCIMYLVGIGLIYMAIKKGCEPALLLPMGFGAILVNLPLSGAINQITEGVGETSGIIQWLFENRNRGFRGTAAASFHRNRRYD